MGSILRISDALPSALAALLVQVTVVLLAALAAHVAASRSPAARYAMLLGALVTAGMCPLLAIATAALDIAPIIPVSLSPQSSVSPLSPDAQPSKVDSRSLTPGSPRGQEVASGPSIVDALFGIWLAGTLLALIRLACGVRIARRIRKSALPIDDRVVEKLLPRVVGYLGRVPPPILVSHRIDVPMAVGCRRPVIVLPAKLVNRLDHQQLLQILIHESAHVMRRDGAVGFYQRLLAAGIWFHPLVHLSNRLLDRAREELCDNWALRAATATEYARTLTTVAESIPRMTHALVAQSLLNASRPLEHRIVGLLNSRRCTMTQLKNWKVAAIVISFIGGACALTCLAAPAVNRSAGYDLSLVVHFEIGKTGFKDGDKITIDEVHGTSDAMTAGNTFIIKGTYHLASAKDAMLAAFVTADSRDHQAMSMQNIPNQKTQTTIVEQGDGQFTLILYLWYDGKPHVSFYPSDGGGSFGEIYFGTGSSVLKAAAK